MPEWARFLLVLFFCRRDLNAKGMFCRKHFNGAGFYDRLPLETLSIVSRKDPLQFREPSKFQILCNLGLRSILKKEVHTTVNMTYRPRICETFQCFREFSDNLSGALSLYVRIDPTSSLFFIQVRNSSAGRIPCFDFSTFLEFTKRKAFQFYSCSSPSIDLRIGLNDWEREF